MEVSDGVSRRWRPNTEQPATAHSVRWTDLIGAMKIYAIATESSECYGHGDYGTERKISREGAYGGGNYPPCFRTREEAEAYIAAMEWKHGKHVVELELRDSPIVQDQRQRPA